MQDFTYYHPTSIDEARSLAMARGAMLLAGGQTLLRDMKRGHPSPSSLVDLAGLLSTQIEFQSGGLTIGAGATHAEVASSAVVARHLPILAGLVGHIGDLAVRNRGTLGGALAANERAGDYPAACLALDATVHTTIRDIVASDFFVGDHRTVLEPGEIVRAATFPVPRTAAYVKFLNPAARYAMVGVFAALAADGSPRLALTGVRSSGAFRWHDAETALESAFTGDRLSGVRLTIDDLAEDLFADRTYRAHLTEVLSRRAVALAASPAPQVIVLSHGTGNAFLRGTDHEPR